LQRARAQAAVVIIDELGPNGAWLCGVRAAVHELLTLDLALVATVDGIAHSITDPLKRRPDIQLVSVSQKNRDELPALLDACLAQGRADRSQVEGAKRCCGPQSRASPRQLP